MINFNEHRMGFERTQRVEGISPITYGRIIKNDLKKFYSVIGCHATINDNVEELFVQRLTSIIKKRTYEYINRVFEERNMMIVDVVIPSNMIKTRKGYLAVDITIDSKVDITVEEILDFNLLISSMFHSIEMIKVYPNNKYQQS